MYISKIALKNFRCHTNLEATLNKELVTIEGENASGKTSILEAINYTSSLNTNRSKRDRKSVV
jgi:putative ATP-dependent endonuclease of OLD family